MDHFQHIYSTQAAEYHRMISVEDYEGNLLRALEQITSFEKARVIDLGTGTGRIPFLLKGSSAAVIGIDLYRDMLAHNSYQRSQIHGKWSLIQGDMRHLPLLSKSASIITAGWSIGHLRDWYKDRWQHEMSSIIEEMQRVVIPNGWLIILETLGTGTVNPKPPSPELTDYYDWLEARWGFSRMVVATDYQFSNVDEAVSYTEFFFGTELAENIRTNSWTRLPEWTGVWSKQFN